MPDRVEAEVLLVSLNLCSTFMSLRISFRPTAVRLAKDQASPKYLPTESPSRRRERLVRRPRDALPLMFVLGTDFETQGLVRPHENVASLRGPVCVSTLDWSHQLPRQGRTQFS